MTRRFRPFSAQDSGNLRASDANKFKQINDTYGHAAGDAVIRTMGRRLSRWTTGRPALAVRLGGDEFAVAAVLPSSSDLADIAALREQL
ncbi:diguanylate cyclase [Streptomyces sp. NPDC056159]|uniref:diguanylate cyclase domain-containing protein n=1 Tax=Streptomyces sp. NPDC056159 TaxID=3155537 RepID=UPI00342CE1DA